MACSITMFNDFVYHSKQLIQQGATHITVFFGNSKKAVSVIYYISIHSHRYNGAS